MAGLFGTQRDRLRTATCFYCNSTRPVKDKRNFLCDVCQCKNIYGDDGQILSVDPAMRDESLNTISFSKRAHRRQDRLPTMFGPGPFCQSCRSNQNLVLNLLSNYLPAQDDPEYEQRLRDLPEYQASLYERYPPVCEQDMPAVEEAIRKKDEMARSAALATWLSRSKGEAKRRVSHPELKREAIDTILWAWSFRGCLWAASFALSILGNAAMATGRRLPLSFSIQPFLPTVVGLSILWSAWDPTYASFKRLQLQGKAARIQGRSSYIRLQMLTWCTRLCTAVLLSMPWWCPPSWQFADLDSSPTTSFPLIYFSSCLALELAALISSFTILRIHRPPTVRLIDLHKHVSSTSPSSSRFGTPTPTSSVSRPTPPPPTALLTTLSLSSQPIMPKNVNPMFGSSSLLEPGPNTASNDLREDDEMDWTPTEPSDQPRTIRQKKDEDNIWLRPQRFFAPEQPTGLESLLERTTIMDAPQSSVNTGTARPVSKVVIHLLHWWFVYALSLLPLLAIGVRLWQKRTKEEQRFAFL